MTTLLLTVLFASLLGSLHCAGMCGPFVAFATLRVKDRAILPTRSGRLQLAYHGGRLFSYVVLGLIAGALGGALDMGSRVLGLGRVAGVLTGIMLVAIGLGRLAGILGFGVRRYPGEAWITRVVGRGQALASRLSPMRRALIVGLLTTALPCGWLYAFVAVAAGTGHALLGGLVLLVFWIGTVPVLAGIGAGIGAVLGRMNRLLQATTAVIVLGLGLHSIVGRANILERSIATPTNSLDAAIERVSMLVRKGSSPCHCKH